MPDKNPNQKVYWVGLLLVLRKACKYIEKWRPYLPDDLPPQVEAAYDAIELACAALKVYDKLNRRGGGQ